MNSIRGKWIIMIIQLAFGEGLDTYISKGELRVLLDSLKNSK